MQLPSPPYPIVRLLTVDEGIKKKVYNLKQVVRYYIYLGILGLNRRDC